MSGRALTESSKLWDYPRIASLIEPGASVLDLGCGGGELLSYLIQERGVRGMGVEIDASAVVECLHKGLSVFQGNLDEGLADYGDSFYDYVILHQTLQVVRRPALVIEEMLRVGKKGIVSFPNFGNWRVRSQLMFKGHMPRTTQLPFDWYDTPNIHLLTIKDFVNFCQSHGILILKQFNLWRSSSRQAFRLPGSGNLLAEEGLFVMTRRPA